jgi:hypothetical protein
MLKTIPIQKNSAFEQKNTLTNSTGKTTIRANLNGINRASGRRILLSGFDSDKEII